jgi:hypothetical protein
MMRVKRMQEEAEHHKDEDQKKLKISQQREINADGMVAAAEKVPQRCG